MKTIIVPVDFSATAASAAEFAGNLATFYNFNIWFYHCYKLPSPVSGFTVSNVEEKTQSTAADEMDAFRKEVQSKLKFALTIRTKTERNSLQEGLALFCDKIKPDIVVMGFSGKSSLANFFEGSNTIKTIHSLNYPVLVIPPKTVFTPVRKIGFACNYDKVLSNSPVDVLEKIIKDFNAELYIIDVHAHNKMYTEVEALEGVSVNELLKKIKPEYHTIESENIAEGIGLYADEANLDWLAAIPRSHSTIDKMFKHSHTKDLLYRMHVPVLCMHE
jgi:nucleotide-binding universal stress UspA family protein